MRRTGSRSGYLIVEWNKGDDAQIDELTQRWPQLVLRRFVAIASCDSGPYKPTEAEFAAGWTQAGTLAVSPRISAVSQLPSLGFDEWYVNGSNTRLSPHENFVNRFQFSTLARKDEFTEKFWKQVVELQPLHVLGAGLPSLFLVTRDEVIFMAITRAES
ncbi:hypothetical protein WN982_36785 [Paraburkholderia sp. IMGN_8]|uniref:hypothetical protein n=1 Tax=Paraburkholderia sp. IMGN_8 TaxID=3136564 RepID=UPI003100C687